MELSSDNAAVAVRAGNFAPDAAVGGALLSGAGLVNVRNALSKVEGCVLPGVHPLDAHKRSVFVLHVFPPLEAQKHSAHIQPALPYTHAFAQHRRQRPRSAGATTPLCTSSPVSVPHLMRSPFSPFPVMSASSPRNGGLNGGGASLRCF